MPLVLLQVRVMLMPLILLQVLVMPVLLVNPLSFERENDGFWNPFR
jgi:hypothetical protein